MSLKLQNKVKNSHIYFRLILFLCLTIIFFACSPEDIPTVIEPTKMPIVPDTISIDPKPNDTNQTLEKVVAPTIDIDKIVETVIARLPTPQIVTIPPSPEIPDIQATAISVLNSILVLTPTLTPFPTSTPTATPTNTPMPTLTPTATLIPSIIRVNPGSTIVSQSGTPITITDAAAFSSRPTEGLAVDIFWGDGTSMKNVAVKDDGTITALHTYTSAGVFRVKFIVTNEHGASGTEEINYVINEAN